ncbi:isocitrate lyase/PEP mutase family protein [Poseidonocella sedimentorum]|uniref:Carboxyvinyl-carboxyphosphonate phosphorylmutase n=1 Tax=Poseidonocella sedimentorum TaxID=871652 RepID=A0A1I6ECV7_9RHOB|nr:isocitrate lyase/PEP mutase family protein [Poseidonocella sedimentorum]SFR15564.1 carboxyvinyl-carboxyphosphonate phosphorylmutase [Poseidonocella sedimentorum]
MADPLSPTKARATLRAILAGESCARPASVFDALSMRAAGALGFPLAMLGGSVAALAVLGAPDHQLLSLDEFAGLCRRITRGGPLPLLVDADHGFGNALNARRCVEELEVAGVAGMTLEDTDLPAPFGATGPRLIPLAEAEAKLRAALDARSDPGFVIVARTNARLQSTEALIARARAFGAAGADALFISASPDPETLAQAGEAAGLPLIIPQPRWLTPQTDLAALGARICLTPHSTLPAALDAAWDSLAASPGAQNRDKPEAMIETLSDREEWARRMARFLER